MPFGIRHSGFNFLNSRFRFVLRACSNVDFRIAQIQDICKLEAYSGCAARNDKDLVLFSITSEI